MIDQSSVLEHLFHLFPFGALVDHDGKFLRIGPSLQKVLKISPGESLIEIMKGSESNKRYSGLPEPLQMFWLRTSSGAQIRGQLLPVSEGFFFSGYLGLNNTQILKQYDLTFKDFSNQDNVFDFLMLMGSQEHSIAQLRRILEELRLKNSLSNLVNEIALELEGVTVIEEVLARTARKLRALFPESGMLWSMVPAMTNDKGEAILSPVATVFELEKDTGDVASSIPEKVRWFAAKVDSYLRTNSSEVILSGCDQSDCHAIIKASDADNHHYVVLWIDKAGVSLAKEGQVFNLIGRLIQSKIAAISAERQKNEIMLQRIHLGRIAMLGELSAGVAHEINNPLAIISFMSEKIINNIRADGLQEKYSKDFEVITHSIERIVKIIQGLRNYARGGISDRHVDVPVKKLFDDTWVLIQNKYKQQKITYETSIEDEGFLVNCSPVQIVQILTNLLSNSADAIAGQPERKVRMCSRAFPDFFRIEVRDSGPRIPEEIANKIMNPFFTTKEPGKGTGLGLSLSQTIASQHKAKFYLDRNQDETCFVLELPRQKS